MVWQTLVVAASLMAFAIAWDEGAGRLARMSALRSTPREGRDPPTTGCRSCEDSPHQCELCGDEGAVAWCCWCDRRMCQKCAPNVLR
jgi:hypothetical protein